MNAKEAAEKLRAIAEGYGVSHVENGVWQTCTDAADLIERLDGALENIEINTEPAELTRYQLEWKISNCHAIARNAREGK